MAKQINKKKASKKRKKFSTADFVAAAVFTLIIAVVIGSIAFYYGIYRPQAEKIVSEKAVEFTELFFDINHEQEFSFEPLYPYLTAGRAQILQIEEDRLIINRQAMELNVEVLETEADVTSIGWEEATVKVKLRYVESSNTKDAETVDAMIMFDFNRVDGQWLISSYTHEEINK